MTVEKPKPKQLLRPITTGADGATNQSQSVEITCNTLKAREKSRVHGAIGFGSASHWLKNWRESFKPITKRSNRKYIITFDSHLKTALFFFFILLSLLKIHTAVDGVEGGFFLGSGQQQVAWGSQEASFVCFLLFSPLSQPSFLITYSIYYH